MEKDDTPNGASSAASKVALQMTKMRDANLKYKNLLKMAKERIEQQEGELTRLRGKSSVLPDMGEIILFLPLDYNAHCAGGDRIRNVTCRYLTVLRWQCRSQAATLALMEKICLFCLVSYVIFCSHRGKKPETTT